MTLDNRTRIKKLSPLLINQLAAGEVVTRPASVVKELLENAIDAGATDIEVHITQGGMGKIEVIDNGVGIHPDDMVMAITRHATSKVADVAHLQGITTLGFRGEALAATAAVSRLIVTSSHDNSGIGRQLQVAGVLAETPSLIPVVHHHGTTITVKDLYFNVPARRGNLKSIATEFAYIETIVRDVAIARADVTLTLYHDQKKRLFLPAHLNVIAGEPSLLPLSRLEQALGTNLSNEAIDIVLDLTHTLLQKTDSVEYQYGKQTIKISGWLWPAYETSLSLPKLLYVNGRLIKESVISNTLRQLARSAQLNDIGYALYFELPAEWLNVNVHPAKQRIKITPLNNIMAHLSHTVSMTLKKLRSKDTSEDNAITKNLGIKESKNRLASAPQVQSLKQPYKLVSPPLWLNKSVGVTAMTAQQANHSVSTTLLSEAIPALIESAHDVNGELALPLCLTRVAKPSYHDDLENLDGNDSDVNVLPWLIFYSQNQLLVIEATRWKKYWSSVVKDSLITLQPLESTENVDGVILINEHINAMSASLSMSRPIAEMVNFKTALHQFLVKNALSSLTMTQLILMMLSP